MYMDEKSKESALYILREVRAVAACDERNAVQPALYVHLKSDIYGDGDCLLFGYTLDSFGDELTDDDVTTALQNETPSTFFWHDEKGIYYEN